MLSEVVTVGVMILSWILLMKSKLSEAFRAQCLLSLFFCHLRMEAVASSLSLSLSVLSSSSPHSCVSCLSYPVQCYSSQWPTHATHILLSNLSARDTNLLPSPILETTVLSYVHSLCHTDHLFPQTLRAGSAPSITKFPIHRLIY